MKHKIFHCTSKGDDFFLLIKSDFIAITCISGGCIVLKSNLLFQTEIYCITIFVHTNGKIKMINGIYMFCTHKMSYSYIFYSNTRPLTCWAYGSVLL